MIKKILIGLLCAIVLFIIVGFLFPSKIELEKSLLVDAPAEYVFEEVNSLERWGTWSYWFMVDTTMKVSYGDKKEGAGATYSWTSSDMGNGTTAIAESVPFSMIKADLNFMEGDTSRAWYNFAPEGDGTRVTMGFSSDFGANPIGRWIGTLLIKPEIEKSFEYGLNRLKELAEAKPKFASPVTLEEIKPFRYIGLKHAMNPGDEEGAIKQFAKMYADLYAALEKAKVEPQGPPIAFYLSYTEEWMEFVTAIPIPGGAKFPSKYIVETNPGGRAVKTISNGEYFNLGTAHGDIDKYLAWKQLEVSGMPWEVYVVGPANGSDASKWVTEVWYPVK